MVTPSIVTDEISADVETAIELGVEWGVRDFELRGWDIHRVPAFTPFQKQRLKELVEQFNVRIVAISPGLFKCPYPVHQRNQFPLRTFDAALYQSWDDIRSRAQKHVEELLPASIEYAQEIGAGAIVAFSFERHARAGPPPDEILETLHHAAEQTSRAGLQLVVEVEDGFWADTGANTAALVKAIDHPALGVNWDPGNAIVAGDVPYPDGYAAIRNYVRHVHFKDVAQVNGAFQYVVEGDIDWARQISALLADEYGGCISVETHMQPKVRSARAMLKRLHALLAEAQGPNIASKGASENG